MTLPAPARALLSVLVLAAVATLVATALGWLSWRFWVIGLFGLTLGVALGFSVVTVSTWLAIPARRLLWVALGLTVLAWVQLQVFEDAHQRQAFREVLFETRAAASGLPPSEIERLADGPGSAFLTRDADALLDAQVEAATGMSGAVGRWVFRLQAGLRLGGPFRGGRGLDVGLVGGILQTVLELGVGLLLVIRITRRAEAAPPPERPNAGPEP